MSIGEGGDSKWRVKEWGLGGKLWRVGERKAFVGEGIVRGMRAHCGECEGKGMGGL